MAYHATSKWEGGLTFKSTVREHTFYVDAVKEQGGQNKGPSPKELVLVGVMNCSSMDVAALLKKFREPVECIELKADADKTSEHPVVFKEVTVEYHITGGAEIKKENVLKAVSLSMTRYCGVSAMISLACPIKYKVFLNRMEIGEGVAHFENIAKS